MKPRILFFITEDWYFWFHRLPIARAARDAGFEVLITTRMAQHKARIEEEGFKLVPISLERRSKNIIKEIISILEIVRIYRREKPDIVHHVAVKPVLYGSWVARIVGVHAVVNALAGVARRPVTVSFSGDGGEKLFGRYNRHIWAPRIWNRIRRWRCLRSRYCDRKDFSILSRSGKSGKIIYPVKEIGRIISRMC